MKVWVVIIQDRHSDVNIEVYDTISTAVHRAEELAKQHCRHPEDYKELKIADWAFHATYSCEGDCVTVLEKEVQ